MGIFSVLMSTKCCLVLICAKTPFFPPNGAFRGLYFVLLKFRAYFHLCYGTETSVA